MGHDINSAEWHTSSFSGSNGGGCVEVARSQPGIVAVRDSKDRTGPTLSFTPVQWEAFTAGVREGEFDLS